MEKVTNLNNYKMKITEKIFEKSIKESNLKFEGITDEFLEEHIKHQDISTETLLKVIWMLSDSMDKLEQEFFRFKMDILQILTNAKEVRS